MHDPLALENHLKEEVNLRDVWRGRSAFMVCGGPSVANVDPALFNRRGVLSIGLNNVAGHLRTTAFCYSDPPQKFHHGIWYDPAMWKFCLRPHRGRSKGRLRVKEDGVWDWSPIKVKECPSTFFYDRDCCFDPENFLTTTTACCGVNDKGHRVTGRPKNIFSAFLPIRLLHYLGVREVFALGMDFSMPASQPYGFAQSKHAGGCRSNNEKYALANEWLKELRPVLEAAGMFVYNCSERSGCTAFDHVPFEDAYERVTAGVPGEPFDLEGWYCTKGTIGDKAQAIVEGREKSRG